MPSSPPALLDPLRFPLRGSRLVEASAGTGKTFTIAALYLRLVLGHGGEAAYSHPLTPPQILVVTFTDAATKELRERIRARLAEAAEAFAQDPADVAPRPPGSDLLHDLRAEYEAALWPTCARQLRLAAEWMDEAAVSTIHGWCNRMLREHAFDSGSPFTQQLVTDLRPLHDEVLRDYWRSFFTPLAAEQAARVWTWWPSPEALGKALRGLLPLVASLGPGKAPAEALALSEKEAARLLASYKAPWVDWAGELRILLDVAVASKRVDGRRLQTRNYGRWLDDLRAWAVGEAVSPLDDKSTAWARLTPGGLAEVFKDAEDCPSHPGLDDMVRLRDRIAELPDGRNDILCHAAHWCAARMDSEQAMRSLMGFQELLTRMDAALQGPYGVQLAATIRRQFPVALIDEFQDTDPLQYRIFDAIYRVASDDPAAALVLIGDPKQAIYAFRGADIHTYLRARESTAGRHATLGTNFRSTEAMVEAVNALFQRAEVREGGQGAFLLRDALPFHPVAAHGRARTWCVEGDAAPALVFWQPPDGEVLGGGAAQQLAAQACAATIVALLAQGRAGQSGFRGEDGVFTPVVPGDIAVLVNSGREARAVRVALRRLGVRSVYLSDRDSVFQSPVAGELQRWLVACADPEDERALRAALATGLLALDWQALDRLNHDALAWEERVLQFRRYQQLTRRQGVLAMLRHLMHDFEVPQRLLAAGQERALTDLLHLAELLQQASAQIDGDHALVRWLAEQRADVAEAGGEGDARKQRLESDAALVQVVTVHKSKGLEYPLVFLPFASAFRAAKPTDLPLVWHDAEGRAQVALQADPAALAQVDRERLGEDLRKFYVALTRARFATWVGVWPVKDVERSAPGHLLGGGAELTPQALHAALRGLALDCAEVALHPMPPSDVAPYDEPAAPPAVALELTLPDPRPPWWIASYSALRLQDAADGVEPREASMVQASGPASAVEDVYTEQLADDAGGPWEEGRGFPSMDRVDQADPAGSTGVPGASDLRLHSFPRGARAGSFLHGLLEWMGRQGFARLHADTALQADFADLVARRCNIAGLSAWTAPLTAWLLRWLHTPWQLQAEGAAATPPVAPAEMGRMQVEMEFWFAATGVDTTMLDALVRSHTLHAVARPVLHHQQVNGMFKGYMDLVFSHGGRWYVADYKSNWLGPDDAAYHPAALRRAVLEHRYELQYVLYVFALHRLLRQRLRDYDYDQHMGGAVYLFLRGHAAPGQGLHAERPPRALIEALDAMFSGQAVAEVSR